MRNVTKTALFTFSLATTLATNSFAHHAAEHAVVILTNDRWEECALDISPDLTQSQWNQFNKDISSLLYFRPMSGAKTLGKRKFNISLEMSQIRVKDYDGSWNNTFSHPEEDHYLVGDNHQLNIPVLSARMGVTNEIDAGIMHTKNPGSNYSWTGVDVKFTFHRDKDTGIDVAARLSTVILLGVEDFDYYQGAADLLVSKKLGMFTPYAGITGIASTANETTDEVNLNRVNLASVEAIAGAHMQWKYLSVAAEADFARTNTYAVKVGVDF